MATSHGAAESTDATVAPSPKSTKSEGSAQQRSVPMEILAGRHHAVNEDALAHFFRRIVERPRVLGIWRERNDFFCSGDSQLCFSLRVRNFADDGHGCRFRRIALV